jgi:hypothetical protein
MIASRLSLTHLAVAGFVLLASCRERANPKDEPPPSRVKLTPASGEPSAPAQGAGTMPNWAEAMKYEVKLDAARKAVVVAIDLAPGFHAYTTGETIGRPLKVEIDADSDLKANGDVTYPTGTAKDLPLGKSVIVEGKAEIVAPVNAEGDLAGKKAKGKFQYQICTDEACDRPRTAPFEITAAPAQPS